MSFLTKKRLSLNEARPQFSPTLWTKKSDNKYTQILSQVWFPGVHCSVGGGEQEHDLSIITLAWMIQKLHTHTKLECDLEYLKTIAKKRTKAAWATGPWEESCVGWYRLGGRVQRTPGQYFPVDETFEAIHKSVHERKEHLGPKFPVPSLNGLKLDAFGGIESELRWK